MRVFLTGATGFIGSAITKELIEAGHQVLGLTRSDNGAKALQAAGAEVHRGSLDDPDSLKNGAAKSDGVIHTAFIHDFSNFKASCETDRRAIETIGSVLIGSNRPFIITSGTALLALGRLAVETDKPALTSEQMPRMATNEAAAAVAAQGVHVSLVRLPPSVHGQGDHHGFVPILIKLARQKGASAYIGEGHNRWPAVHRLDAANLFRLALEKGAKDAVYHAVDDEGVPTRDIAETIGRRLHLPVVSKSAAEAPEHFGWFNHFFSLDAPASSKQTREILGWKPTHPRLIADLEQGFYFSAPF